MTHLNTNQRKVLLFKQKLSKIEHRFLTRDYYLKGIKNKERFIYNLIYTRFRRPITQFIVQKGGNKQDGEEIFQEGLCAVWMNLKKKDIQLDVHFYSYLKIVCRNIWHKRLNKKKRMPISSLENIILLEAFNLFEDEELKIKKEAFFNELFENLSVRKQFIFNEYAKGTPVKEIAKILETSEQCVRKTKCLEVKKMRNAIQKRFAN